MTAIVRKLRTRAFYGSPYGSQCVDDTGILARIELLNLRYTFGVSLRRDKWFELGELLRTV